ncbi:MAG: hypothetical protein ACLRNW_01845 [Neglectibacter sp.]
MEGTVLDMMQVYDDLDEHIINRGYDVRRFGYDPYNAQEFIKRWTDENGPFGVEVVRQGSRTESVPLGELKSWPESVCRSLTRSRSPSPWEIASPWRTPMETGSAEETVRPENRRCGGHDGCVCGL